MQEQFDEYFSDLLSKYQCGFKQVCGTQNCLLAMIEKPSKMILSDKLSLGSSTISRSLQITV